MTNQTPIQQQVLGSIKGGQVRMRPKIYFVGLATAGVALSVSGGILMAYAISIMTYILRIATADTPARGARANLAESWTHFPWWAVIISLIFLWVGLYLLRAYGQLYRIRTRFVITAVVVAVTIVGVTLSYVQIGHLDNQSVRPGSMRGSGAGAGQRH